MATKKTGTTSAKGKGKEPDVPKKNRVLRYKKAQFRHPGDQCLQTLVQQAVTKLGGVQRREQVDTLSGTRVVLSGVVTSNNMLVGKLMLYTPGQQQKYLELDQETQDYRLGSLPVGGAKDAGREFVESIMYVSIFEKHVAFIGSAALRSGHLEGHLNWLLNEAELIATGDYVYLEDQQSSHALSQLSKHPVKAIEIGGEIQFDEESRVNTVRKTESRETKPGHRIMKPVGALADAAASLFGPIFSDASLKSPFKHKEHVGFKMVLQYRNRNKTKEGIELMESLAIAGRHFDEGECVVRLDGGGKLTAKDIKVAKTLSFECLQDGRLKEPVVWTTIHGWMQSAISGKIIGS